MNLSDRPMSMSDLAQTSQKNKAKKKLTGRPWGDDARQASVVATKWWIVRRLGRKGIHKSPCFRHGSLEDAQREADFLAANVPNEVFVVLELISRHYTGKPKRFITKAMKQDIPAS